MDVKLIPNTTGYLASTSGVIFDADGFERIQYENGDGYRTASVKLLDGRWQTFGVHRLVALAHIPFNGDPEEYTVNHIDGIVENNRRSNLEWLSVKMNNVHASLLRGSKDRPVILARRPDGAYEFIADLKSAAEFFVCDLDLVWEAIRDQRPLNGWLLSHHSTKSIIPMELRKPNFPGGRGKGQLQPHAVSILDFETKEVKVYPTLHAAATTHNVSPSHVYQCISKDGKTKLFKKRYFIVTNDEEFPSVTEEEFEELKAPGGKTVLAYNTNTQGFVVYESASQFIQDCGLSKKAVTTDLKNDRLRELNGWWYTYLTKDKADRLKVIVGVQTDG